MIDLRLMRDDEAFGQVESVAERLLLRRHRDLDCSDATIRER